MLCVGVFLVVASRSSGFSCCRTQALGCSGLVAQQQVESSWTRNRTRAPCIGRRILNHWTTGLGMSVLCLGPSGRSHLVETQTQLLLPHTPLEQPKGRLEHSVLRQISVVQSLSFVTSRDRSHQAPLASTISWSSLQFTSSESVMLSKHFIICHPLLLLPSVFPNFGVFPVSRLFTSGGQSIGASVSASVLPVNIQG